MLFLFAKKQKVEEFIMAKTMASAVVITVPKASSVFGKMLFQEAKETENPNTKEKIKKAVILSKKLKDVFEITVPYETDLSVIQDDTSVDFDNVEVTFRANARNGYGNTAVAWLTINGVAESIHTVDNNTGKPIDKKDNKS